MTGDEFAKAKQPLWIALPFAAKVRLHLLKGEIKEAARVAGPEPLGFISIPYPRYSVLVGMANVELALAQKDYASALSMVDDLLALVAPVTRVDVPEVMSRRADALLGLERVEEAHQVLTQACSLAKGLGSKHSLWSIFIRLADINAILGNDQEAESNRADARRIVEQIAESLREIGLGDSFLNQPQVQKLTRE